jgi:hypothetical protein
MEDKNGNDFSWIDRKIAEFVIFPILIWDWIQMFFTVFMVTKQPVASWKFANYMSTDLIGYMQERGWYK